MLAKTRQTWKMDGMNTVEYEVVSRDYLPLYTNITVNIGTESGLRPPAPKPAAEKAAAAQNPAAEKAAAQKLAANSSNKLQEKLAVK